MAPVIVIRFLLPMRLIVTMILILSRFLAPSRRVGKAVRNYSVCMGIRRQILNFTLFVNGDVKILGRRFYSPSLKVVTWLKDALLIFLMFHTSAWKFGWLDERLDAVQGKNNENKKVRYFLNNLFLH